MQGARTEGVVLYSAEKRNTSIDVDVGEAADQTYIEMSRTTT